MSTLGNSLANLIGLATYLISLGIYGYMIYIILKHLAPRLITANKVTMNMLVGPALSFIVVLLAIEHAPVMIAESINRGYEKSMPVLLETAGDLASGFEYFGGGGSYQDAPQYLFSVEQEQPSTIIPVNNPIIAATPVNPIVTQENTHTVEPGETLHSIAAMYNIHAMSIVELNSLPNDDIRVGQVLILPGQPMIRPTATVDLSNYDPAVNLPPTPEVNR